MKTTELNLIPIFVAIFEEQNLSRAATRLDISQPAVSKALARLRDIYDEPLFHRSTSGVEPTSFAIDIYPAMSAALKNYTSTLSASREFDPKVTNRTFSIASVSVPSYQLLPLLLKQIRQHAPNIALEIHPLFTEDYESDLRLQRYDLIIDIEPRGRTTLKHEQLYSEEMIVVCAKDHPRIGDTISLEGFLDEEHVVVSRWQSRTSLLGEHITELAKRKVAYRASGAFEMLPVISGGEYIGIWPCRALKSFTEQYQLKAIPLPFSNAEQKLSMIWHQSRTQESGHEWLRTQLKQAVKALGY